MSKVETVKRRKVNPFSLLPGNSQLQLMPTDGPTEENASSSRFKPGNIIKLRVWNFTTYSYGEFNLSPSLNMIIGPNGTGKSTFVAAVCLGLGGKIDLIKRKSLDSMVKSGEKESTIAITMKNEPGYPDIVIERRFAVKSTKSQWKVNGKSCDANYVNAVATKFNIQLDNLCHFLPQERVSEFASLSPEKLLLETERTIGDNTLLDKHKQLIELDESWVDLTKAVDLMDEQMESIRADVEKFELEAQKFQEYEDKTRQIECHKKVLPYAKLQDMKEKLKHLKNERDAAKKALQEFDGNTKPLKHLIKEVEKKQANATQKHKDIKELIAEMKAGSEQQTRKADNMALSFSTAQSEIELLKTRTELQKKELELSVQEKEEAIRRLLAMEAFDMSKVPELTAKRQEKHEERTQIEDEFDTVEMSHNRLKRDLRISEQSFDDERKKLETNDRLEILRTRNTRYRRELMENAYEAHTFMRRERTPDMKYFEAPVVSCRVTDRRYAKYLEKVIDNNTLFSFYFENEGQYKAVSGKLPPNLNVPMRTVSRTTPSLPMGLGELKSLGFDGYLSDFITGPAPVLEGLKQRSALNRIPVSLNPLPQAVMDKLLRPGPNGRTQFQRILVGDDLIVVNQSKYGSRQVFYQTERIAPAQLMGAEGLSEEVKREMQQRLANEKEKIKEKREKLASLEAEKAKFLDAISKVDEEMSELDREIKSLRKKHEAKLRMEANITHIEGRIASLTRNINQDHSEQIREKEAALLELYVSYAEATKAAAEASEEIALETANLKKAEVLQQQVENEVLSYISLMNEMEHKQEELLETYRAAKAKCDEYKRGDAAEEIRRQKLTPEERDAVKNLVQKYMDEGKLTENFIVTMIDHLQEDLSVLSNVDRGSLELLKMKKQELEAAETNLPQLIQQRDATKAKLDEVFAPWERELSGMVDQISKAFQKRFVTVASDGQVELVKLERFRDWKLEILVKFRENAELKVLDHQSQSGGERAVSTIFFIMSLQGLTRAPIRIVDEINQGMDPKNETKAHKYFVHTACRNRQSQYFLVTPKLLLGLYYHPEMTIHCIYTGPFMAKQEPNTASSDLMKFQKLVTSSG